MTPLTIANTLVTSIGEKSSFRCSAARVDLINHLMPRHLLAKLKCRQRARALFIAVTSNHKKSKTITTERRTPLQLSRRCISCEAIPAVTNSQESMWLFSPGSVRSNNLAHFTPQFSSVFLFPQFSLSLRGPTVTVAESFSPSSNWLWWN